MDVLAVNMKSKIKQAKRSKKAIKVVYISSPMKVETSASKFKALVQELTGKDSDTARFMDGNNSGDDDQNSNLNYSPNLDLRGVVDEQRSLIPFMNSYNNDSSSSSPDSDSIFEVEQFDKGLPPMDGSFTSMFQSNIFHEYYSHELDVFN